MSEKEGNLGAYPPPFLDGLDELVNLRGIPEEFQAEMVNKILQILERYEDWGEVSSQEDWRVFNATEFTLKEISRALNSYKKAYLKGVDY